MIEIKNISKHYKDFHLKDITFSVNSGEYFVLLGKSGAGKSVILEIIAGLIKPDKGSIILDEKEITHESIQKRQVGLVFQDHAIFPHIKVKNNIAYALKSKGYKKEEIKNRVEELARKMGIYHLLDRNPATLSGGELQRVALARTLAHEPVCLLLDEPLASLDVQLRGELRSLLRKINKSGITVIHVTHDFEDAIVLANKIAIIQDGSIIQSGTINEVFQFPKSEFVANLTGIKNLYKATLITDGAGLKKACISDKLKIYVLTEENNCDGYLMIRSEDIILSNEKQISSTTNNFEGKILEIVRARLGVEILIDIGVKVYAIITQRSRAELELTTGKKIWICFKASAVKFIKN